MKVGEYAVFKTGSYLTMAQIVGLGNKVLYTKSLGSWAWGKRDIKRRKADVVFSGPMAKAQEVMDRLTAALIPVREDAEVRRKQEDEIIRSAMAEMGSGA